ncbi:MAG: hypothetical protein IKE94_13835 [Aeriscardovia sp.]|nr:hypothetical protein [Aeriscardovia sp.]
MNIEKLKKANGVTEDKKPNDKQRIAELEQENEELHLLLNEVTDGLIEIADIVGEKGNG